MERTESREHEERERLQRDVHRLRRFVPMLAIGFVLLLAWQLAPGPRTVEARKFVVRDDRGVARVMLTMWDGDKPTVRLNDRGGKARAMFFLRPERGGAVRFTDTSGHNRVRLMLTEDGTPQLLLANEGGRTRTILRTVEGDVPGLILNDEDLHWLWVAPPRPIGR